MVLPHGRDLRKELSQSVSGVFHEKTNDTNRPSFEQFGSLRSEPFFKDSSSQGGKWRHDKCPDQSQKTK